MAESKQAAAQAITFSLNGKVVSVPLAQARRTTLASWIRDEAYTTGVKVGCGQGGCGACTVAIARPGDAGRSAAASCLFPLVEAHGCDVLTTEGLVTDGVAHPIQRRLAEFNGTQCGFCSPGMVMAMYSQLNRLGGGSQVTQKQLERMDVLGGNLCRCVPVRTGA